MLVAGFNRNIYILLVYTKDVYTETFRKSFIKNDKMTDLFDNIIICKDCGKRMKKAEIVRNGIPIRYAFCEKCGKKEYHPLDIERYKEFQQLKQRPFRVKLRMVGNSYAVSIPRQIIDFFSDAKKLTEEVEMQFAEFDKLMLTFHEKVHQKIFKKNKSFRNKI